MAAILKAAAMAAQHLPHWEIVDYAGADKPDVRAAALAETRRAGRGPDTGAAVPPSWCWAA
jgi:hypothetical protein